MQAEWEHLVSPDSGGQPPAEITKQLLADPERSFDPLHLANRMISEQALMAFGDYLEGRSYCPLCEVEENLGRGQSFEWIDVDADSILQACRERNLAGTEEL